MQIILKNHLTLLSSYDRLILSIQYQQQIRKVGESMTNDFRLGEMESRFADILWCNCPMKSNEMIKLAEEQLNWKRPTTYTVLKKFIERGMFQNENTIVTALVTREEFYAGKSTDFVEKSFSGSLPQFLTAFGSRKKLSSKEIEELKKFIEEQESKEET